MADYQLKSIQFRKERERSWNELERLLRKVEKGSIRTLSHQELTRLPTLYHGAVSALSVARAVSLDKALLGYLTNLVSRAYVVVYSSKRQPREAAVDFLMREWPRTVRRYWRHLVASIALMVAGATVGFLMVDADPDRYYTLVGEDVAEGRDPGATTEELRETLYDEDATALDQLNAFATFLFTHNAKVGILAFALGFAAGAPTIYLIFYNGLLLGAMTAVFHALGLGGEFMAWVLPHGVTELLAICLCGAAGLAFGSSIVFPGEYSRIENVARRGRRIGLIVLGAVVMLFLAALIEGFFRQLVHDQTVRWTVVGITTVLWIAYFGFAGRSGESEGELDVR